MKKKVKMVLKEAKKQLGSIVAVSKKLSSVPPQRSDGEA